MTFRPTIQPQEIDIGVPSNYQWAFAFYKMSNQWFKGCEKLIKRAIIVIFPWRAVKIADCYFPSKAIMINLSDKEVKATYIGKSHT